MLSFTCTHSDQCRNHALKHGNNITDAEAPYLQRVKWAGSVHLHSHGLHICLFFPESEPSALGESNESHAGGAALKVCHRGEAPGPGLESPITTQSPRQRISPDQRNSSAAERASAHWKRTINQHATLQARRCVWLLLWGHLLPGFSLETHESPKWQQNWPPRHPRYT